MNPLIEQHDINLLMYIRNKFKLRIQKDTTVSLLVDEIHLKPYFDYKGGNIVGLSENSNETAANTLVLNNYNNIVVLNNN